jgi:Zn-dependent protease with chaperone function
VFAASFILAGLAIALAWPVPILLAHANWPDRAPGTALVVWQSIALAGGLSMIGAMLTFGLVPFGDNLATGLRGFVDALVSFTIPAGANFLQMFALAVAILLGLHLLLSLATTFFKAERLRRRHLQLVTLLSHPVPERPGARMIDEAAPVAYCLPGTTRSITVLSAGLIELLDADQLTAVIAHERAHGLQRHHLVLLAFRAWRGSLPWFPIATRAHEAVAILVELLADDYARRIVSSDALATSIAVVGAEAPSVEAPAGLAGMMMLGQPEPRPAASRRVARLLSTVPPLSLGAKLAAMTAAVLLLAIPTVLLVAPTLA